MLYISYFCWNVVASYSLFGSQWVKFNTENFSSFHRLNRREGKLRMLGQHDGFLLHIHERYHGKHDSTATTTY